MIRTELLAGIALILSPSVSAKPPLQQQGSPDKPWSLVASLGTQSLGFAPDALHPTGRLGIERRLVERGIYHLRASAEVGGFQHARFAKGILVDTSLQNHLQTQLGLYGSLDVIIGGQLFAQNQTVYQLSESGGLAATSPPWTPSARIGLGTTAGYDFGSVRLFAQYRQYMWTPFMPGNDVPLMGFTTLSAGIAVPF